MIFIYNELIIYVVFGMGNKYFYEYLYLLVLFIIKINFNRS